MFWTCNSAYWPPGIVDFSTVCTCIGTGTESGTEFYSFGIHVFKAYEEFDKQIQVENCEELVAYPIFCSDNILVGNKTLNNTHVDKSVFYFTFLLFKRFKELYRINTDYNAHNYWMCKSC